MTEQDDRQQYIDSIQKDDEEMKDTQHNSEEGEEDENYEDEEVEDDISDDDSDETEDDVFEDEEGDNPDKNKTKGKKKSGKNTPFKYMNITAFTNIFRHCIKKYAEDPEKFFGRSDVDYRFSKNLMVNGHRFIEEYFKKFSNMACHLTSQESKFTLSGDHVLFAYCMKLASDNVFKNGENIIHEELTPDEYNDFKAKKGGKITVKKILGDANII